MTGPLVGLLWIATAVASHLSIRPALPWQATGPSPGLGVGIHLVAVAVGVSAWAAILGIATTGRLTRWLPARPRRAPTAVAVAGFGAVNADGLGLALLAPLRGTPHAKQRHWLDGADVASLLDRVRDVSRAAGAVVCLGRWLHRVPT